MLDAIPEGLELRAVQHRLPCADQPALVRVFDLDPPGQLAQDVSDLVPMCREFIRHGEGIILERLPESVLHLSSCVDEA